MAAFLSCRLAIAAAQESQTIEPEKSAVIATADNPFENIVAGKGVAVSSTSKADSRKFDLVYKAPASSAGSEDVVTYTSGGKNGRVAVSISTTGQQGTLNDSQHYGASFKVLFGLFVLAVVLESGLAVIFNWRPFLQVFDARGVKTIVSLLFAWLIVWKFDLDIATQLVNVLWDSKYQPSGVGMFVSALVLAGGSSGVNTLLVALGFRSFRSAESTTPKPPPTQAWIAVILERNLAVGPVYVQLICDGGPASVAGTILGSTPKTAFTRFFLRNPGRFPTSGGYTVTPGKTYTVQLQGNDSGGQTITSATCGPHAFAPGAIVDIGLKL